MRAVVRKWYMDLVTEEGVAWVGYAARVRIHGLRFGYAGWIQGGALPRGGAHRASFRACLPTEEEGGALRWEPRSLGLRATWTPHGAGAPRVLRSDPPRMVWDVRATTADARVEFQSGALAGVGYVECLDFDGPLEPGIDVLHWGRWIADDGGAPRSLVWIRWEGPRPLLLVQVDGEEVEAEAVDTERVAGAFGELALGPSRALRSGGLGATVLEHLPAAVRRVARRIRGWDETKWVSRGALVRPGEAERAGWAIHEVVRFGGRR